MQRATHGAARSTRARLFIVVTAALAPGALLLASSCSTSPPSTGDDTGETGASEGWGIVCQDPEAGVLAYCASQLGPVDSPDVAEVGTIVRCTADYPLCLPPGLVGPGWRCCFNCYNPPLIGCMGAPPGDDAATLDAKDAPLDAKADTGDAALD